MKNANFKNYVKKHADVDMQHYAEFVSDYAMFDNADNMSAIELNRILLDFLNLVLAEAEEDTITDSRIDELTEVEYLLMFLVDFIKDK